MAAVVGLCLLPGTFLWSLTLTFPEDSHGRHTLALLTWQEELLMVRRPSRLHPPGFLFLFFSFLFFFCYPDNKREARVVGKTETRFANTTWR